MDYNKRLINNHNNIVHIFCYGIDAAMWIRTTDNELEGERSESIYLPQDPTFILKICNHTFVQKSRYDSVQPNPENHVRILSRFPYVQITRILRPFGMINKFKL